ncbi:hypothetical protein NKR23_g3985 [Pleurostoma richardsiae]|uniref:Methylated-DNA--protein-cysteine methyltransferase n=1 Tax=Pleurostoma richardsiae TaxID=41990 RepID=A0AA38RWY2_9PEZI|nr:hypothetical protein NKR23_g3985 [Pleurostoma richardsiae]
MGAGLKRKMTSDSSLSASSTPRKLARPAIPAARRDLVPATGSEEDVQRQLERIALSERTPFEKRVWSLLCQVPRGHFTTYGIMSAHLDSSPRAIGNALRRNPFAPQVPCHRVVATGGKLGGFKGQWPRDGEGITLDEKRKLLGKEGVKFDKNGRVIGTPFTGFC